MVQVAFCSTFCDAWLICPPSGLSLSEKWACCVSLTDCAHAVAALKEVWVTGASQVFLVMEKCEGGEVFDAIASR